MRDRQTGRPRGFGFVTFVEHDVADRVVEDIHVIDGRQVGCPPALRVSGSARAADDGRPCRSQIDAKKSVPQEQKPKARKIFVGGLGPETTEGERQGAGAPREPRGPPSTALG